ncbi:citrate:H+ symporter [Nesterenkonia sp. E16_7]|uniref:CitMHS family transporter n=1 Tax=unclassified Nesterenkonia TaxID=2629769 RepID=UPI001A914A1E|nr:MULTISPECIES: SLC13 family permease [unclassified Nesterenkonia]MBO0595770.1 citrate:H+ symporter [Nesterenkonia sp. E16_10]MBO0599631.1 citrate:H+ symporter [Nesterenkonia sp. E16_7]
MLSLIGLAVIVTMTTLLIMGRIAPIVGLTVIPFAGALLAGFSFTEIGDFFGEGIGSVLDVAVMLIFAILFFGIMNHAGLFDPLVRLTVRLTRGNVIAICVGTVLLAAVCHLDGAGASTFLIVIPALLPLYRHLGMSPYLLLLLAGMSMGVLNMLPWGGPVARSAAVVGMDPIELWRGLIPVQILCLVMLVVTAVLLGLREQRRIAARARAAAEVEAQSGEQSGQQSGGQIVEPAEEPVEGPAEARVQERELVSVASNRDVTSRTTTGSSVSDTGAGRGSSATSSTTSGGSDRNAQGAATTDAYSGEADDLWGGTENALATPRWKMTVNTILVLGMLALLISDILPSPLAFMLGLSGALVINYPKVSDQMEALKINGGAAVTTGAIVLAAGCFLGILEESGMLESLATDAVSILPAALIPYLHLIVGVFGLPLELLLSTDAHYFALLPVVEGVSTQAGVSTLAVVYAVLVGNIIGTFISPFSAALWLALGLAGCDIGKHIRYSFVPMWIFSVVALVLALVLGLIPWS